MKIGNKILNNGILPKHAYVGSISVFTCEHLQKKVHFISCAKK